MIQSKRIWLTGNRKYKVSLGVNEWVWLSVWSDHKSIIKHSKEIQTWYKSNYKVIRIIKTQLYHFSWFSKRINKIDHNFNCKKF